MIALRRQQLVWLAADTWQRALTQPPSAAGWDQQALECLQYWARSDLPLVVTRQQAGRTAKRAHESLALGLPAPACWERRRLLVDVPAGSVCRVGRFPSADTITDDLPGRAQDDWRGLCTALLRLQVAALAYGSYGWQRLTGLAYLHPYSDIDLLVVVDTSAQADAAAALLLGASFDVPRIDGEIVFGDGAAVPRAGRVERVLVKRPDGAALEDPRWWAAA